MKITVIDQRDPGETRTAEYEVVVTVDDARFIRFKSTDLPPPALGRKFFLGGREMDVAELKMEVEEGKAMFHFSAKLLPQP